MKKINVFSLLFSLVLLLAAGFGCAAARQDNAVAYCDRANWVILPAAGEAGGQTKYDLFYVYPTLNSSKTQPLMNWRLRPALRSKAVAFAAAQTGIFGSEARVFAPFVRQLEITRSLEILAKEDQGEANKNMFRYGVADTVAAFRYYRRTFNPEGRPFILFGHSQGAVDLYWLLKSCPEITREKGFVAAYLAGLPRVTPQQVKKDFAARDISAARGRSDTGVLVIWNTQNKEAGKSIFTGGGNCCINLLNWRTDSEYAPRTDNAGAVLYDWRSGKTKRVAAFCGAFVDPVKGALIVDLPSAGKWDAHGSMGRGVFHGYDVWFFAENLRHNASCRVDAWHKQFGRKR